MFCTGLPLNEDIEGAASLNEVEFFVGARPTERGTDSNFVGLLTGLVVMPHTAPLGFSGCVLQCLEFMTADTLETDIIASSFDREQRQLVLYGPASPEAFEAVLQTITYVNLALDINLARIEVDVHDGVNNTVETITVIQGMMRRRRDVTTMAEEPASHLNQRHILSAGEPKEETESVVKAGAATYWPLFVIALSSIGILVAILVVWGVRPKQVLSSLA